MIITISGNQGAGKTTVGKLLAEKLGYRFVSIGDLRGQIATERGLTIDELNVIGEKESWVHERADEKTIEIGKTHDNFVIEGWLAYHFIPHSKKVFLTVDETVGAERVFADQRLDEDQAASAEEMKTMLRRRREKSDEQFRRYYGVNFLDPTNYDIVIDTTRIGADEVVGKILERLG